MNKRKPGTIDCSTVGISKQLEVHFDKVSVGVQLLLQGDIQRLYYTVAYWSVGNALENKSSLAKDGNLSREDRGIFIKVLPPGFRQQYFRLIRFVYNTAWLLCTGICNLQFRSQSISVQYLSC